MQQENLDTANDIARFFNVSLAMVRKLTSTGKVPCLRVDRAVRYDRTAVLNWFKNKQQNG